MEIVLVLLELIDFEIELLDLHPTLRLPKMLLPSMKLQAYIFLKTLALKTSTKSM